MFVTKRYQGYNRHEQMSAGGLFLLIFNQESGGELRAVVRYARMVQCGHFVMGSVKVGSQRVVLSGDYGGDGLPISNQEVTEALWDRLHPVPAELAAKFWKGDGWNAAGKEGPTMRAWARANEAMLRNLLPAGEKSISKNLAAKD